jgi:hypothetical protein
MAVKSLIETAHIDQALKSHNCRANKNHRILKGAKRLKVRKGLGWIFYCEECAIKIIDRDIAKLTKLRMLEPEQEPNEH